LIFQEVPNTLLIQQYNSRISFTEDNEEGCKLFD